MFQLFDVVLAVAAPAVPSHEFLDSDVNDDLAVNAVDLLLVINAALGLISTYDCDLNDDGLTNTVDVQLMINDLLGL